MWGNKKKLLIIDDTEIIRALFVADFEDDMDIFTACDGVLGLAAAVEHKPDVIILDVNLPDISGMDVLQRLAALPQTRSIPVVVITASEYNLATERQAKAEKNFRGFLSKGAPTEVIRKTVMKAMD